MAADFKLHLFTPETPRAGEPALLRLFLDAGLDRLHLRHPGIGEDELATMIETLPERHRPKIILHDHPGIARRYGCGFQLNSRHEKVNFSPRELSRSCHSRAEAAEALSGGQLAFVTLSPVFDSISKDGYRANPSLLAREENGKTVALGGVTLSSLPALEAEGFAGAALLGEVWNRPDGPARLLKYLRMRNVAFQFITNGHTLPETVDQALTVLSGGGRWIQVRMKSAHPDEVRDTLIALRPHCEEVGATLIVDDHFALLDYCHGVHLGQNDAPVGEVRALAAPDKIIGLTINDETHLKASLADLPDYYGIGPFRFTTTKERLAPVLGLEGYARLSPLIPRPFVAIGGITGADIPALRASGVTGIAMSSALINADDPQENIKNIIHHIYEK